MHLEHLADLSTEEFLAAFTRFVSRRGVPAYILADNFSTYKCAAKHLGELWPEEAVPRLAGFLSEHKIVWTYSTEKAAWENGAVESLIKCIKTSMKAAIGRKMITCRQFDTLLPLLESQCNTRPLTAVREDGLVCIRPADLIGISRPVGLPSLTDNPNLDPS